MSVPRRISFFSTEIRGSLSGPNGFTLAVRTV
jgi:hypothetical protein